MSPRKKPAATSGSNLRLFYIVLAVVALAGLGTLGYQVLGAGAGGAALEPVEVAGLDDPRALVEMAQGVGIGDPNAPVKVIEFGDYQCPGCADFARRLKPLLDVTFIQTGKVHFVYHDFPLLEIHPHAFLAARAARCAGDQEKFWEYHDLLFARQQDWSLERIPPVGKFADYAAELGLDRGAFQGCVASDRHADVVTANRRLAEELMVNQTPTVIVNMKRVRDLRSFDELRSLIEQEVGA